MLLAGGLPCGPFRISLTRLVEEEPFDAVACARMSKTAYEDGYADRWLSTTPRVRFLGGDQSHRQGLRPDGATRYVGSRLCPGLSRAVPISRRPSRRIVRLVIPRRAKTIFLDSAIVHWRNCHSTSTTQRFELGRADTAKSRLRWALSIVLIDFFLRSRLPTQAVISVKVAGVIHLSRTSRPDESLYGLTKLVRVQRPDATSSEWSCTGRFAS